MFPIFCAICESEQLSLWDLGNHISMNHLSNNSYDTPSPMKKVENFVKVDNKENKDFECKYCLKAFPKNKSLLRHIRAVHLDNYTCGQCTQKFFKQKCLSDHVKECHKGQHLPTLELLVPKKNEQQTSKIGTGGHFSLLNKHQISPMGQTGQELSSHGQQLSQEQQISPDVQEVSRSGSSPVQQSTFGKMVPLPNDQIQPANKLLLNHQQQKLSNGRMQTSHQNHSKVNQQQLTEETDEVIEVSTDFASNYEGNPEEYGTQTPPPSTFKKLTKMEEIKVLHQTLNQPQNSLSALTASKGVKRPQQQTQLPHKKRQAVEPKSSNGEAYKMQDQLPNQLSNFPLNVVSFGNGLSITRQPPGQKSNQSNTMSPTIKSSFDQVPKKPANEISTFFASSPSQRIPCKGSTSNAPPKSSRALPINHPKDEITSFFSQSPKTASMSNKMPRADSQSPKTQQSCSKTANGTSKLFSPISIKSNVKETRYTPDKQLSRLHYSQQIAGPSNSNLKGKSTSHNESVLAQISPHSDYPQNTVQNKSPNTTIMKESNLKTGFSLTAENLSPKMQKHDKTQGPKTQIIRNSPEFISSSKGVNTKPVITLQNKKLVQLPL